MFLMSIVFNWTLHTDRVFFFCGVWNVVVGGGGGGGGCGGGAVVVVEVVDNF